MAQVFLEHQPVLKWHTVLGAGTDACSVPLAVIGSQFGAAQVGYATTSSALESRMVFPHYMRTNPTNAGISFAVAEYVKAKGWKQIAVVHDSGGFGSTYVQSVLYFMEVANVDVVPVPFDPEDAVASMDKAAEALAAGDEHGAVPRIILMIVLDSFVPVIAQSIEKHGLFGKEFHHIFTEGLIPERFDFSAPPYNVFEGAVQFVAAGGTAQSPSWNALQSAIGAATWDDLGPSILTQLPALTDEIVGWSLTGPLDSYAAFAYDAMAITALAACSLAAAGQPTPSATELVNQIRITSFMGASGFVQLGATTGSRTPPTAAYVLRNLRRNEDSSTAAFVSPVVHLIAGEWVQGSIDDVLFYGGVKDVPADGSAAACRAGEELVGVKCAPCQDGYISPTSKTARCTACPKGTYAHKRTQCLECESDSYQDENAQTQCKSCPAHSAYVEHSGSEESPFFHRLGGDDKEDCKCLEGYHSGPGGECVPCPVGGLCRGTGSHDVIDPVPLPGWYERGGEANMMLKCRNADACPGGGVEVCGDGYEDDLCSACKRGWHITGGVCRECTSSNRDAANAAVIMLMVLGVLVYISANVDRNSGKLRSSIAVGAVGNAIILFLQIFSLLLNVRVHWPPELQRLMLAFAWINVDVSVFSPECAYEDLGFAVSWRIKATLPYYFSAMYFAYAFARSVYVRVVSHRSSQPAERNQAMRFAFYRSVNASLQIWSLVHVNTSTVVLQAFACVDQPDGSRTMPVYAAFDCDSDEYRHEIMPVAWFSLITVAIGFPLVLAAVLYGGCTEMSEGAMAATSGISQPFKKRFFFWEVVDLCRKLLLAIALTYGASLSVGKQVAACTFIMVAALVAQVTYRPFKHINVNALTNYLFCVLIFILVAAGMVFSEDGNVRQGGEVFLVTAEVVIWFGVLSALAMGILVVGSAVYTVAKAMKVNKVVQHMVEVPPDLLRNTMQVLHKVDAEYLIEHTKEVIDDEDTQRAFNESICLLFFLAASSDQWQETEEGKKFADILRDTGRSNTEVARLISNFGQKRRIKRAASLARLATVDAVHSIRRMSLENMKDAVVRLARRASTSMMAVGRPASREKNKVEPEVTHVEVQPSDKETMQFETSVKEVEPEVAKVQAAKEAQLLDATGEDDVTKAGSRQ